MPRRSARSSTQTPSTSQTTSRNAEVSVYPDAAQTPRLAALAPELLDEILSYLRVLPLSLSHRRIVFGFGGISTLNQDPLNYTERTDVLRALAQTCCALRKVAHPRLWQRLDCLFVPQRAKGTWYKYTMAALDRKKQGLLATPSLLQYIRTISFTITASKSEEMIAALASFLPELTALRTIQVLGCNQPGKLSAAVKHLSLDTVRMLAVDSDAHALVRCSPNATHVRCTGASNVALLSALAICPDLERFDGTFDWRDRKTAQRLVKNAPNLQSLELRHSWFSTGAFTHNRPPCAQDAAPASDWVSDCLPEIARLEQLATLEISFPVPRNSRGTERAEELRRSYEEVVVAARKIMQNRRKVVGRRRLIVQHIDTPAHHDQRKEELVVERSVETFD